MIQETKFSLYGMMVWLTCAIFFTYEFLLRTVLGTFQHPIVYDLNLTPFRFAILSTTAYISLYGLMQIPVGLIADRFGLKKSLVIAVLICALSGIGFSFTYQFSSAVFARMFMGLGSSFGFICLLISVYDWMPKKYYGFFIGLSQFIGTMGPMIAAGPFHSMAESGHIDWRTIFLSLGLFGLLLAFPILFIVENNKQNIGKFKILTKSISVKSSLAYIFKQKQLFLIALYSALVYFALEYLSENEGKAFIELNGYSPKFASYMLTVGWLGYAIACPLLGFISDYLKRRKIIMILTAACCLISMITILYFPMNKIVLLAAFLGLGFGAAGQSIGFAIMAEQCGKLYLAAGLGFNNAVICVLSAVNAPFIGWLLEIQSQSSWVSKDDYVFALSSIILCIVMALLIAIFFLKETYCRPTKEYTYISVS